MAFSRNNRTVLASLDLEAFNPMPLPLIAYVCAAVSLIVPLSRLESLTPAKLRNGLDEYEHGVQRTIEFGKKYRRFYNLCLSNLRRMEMKDNKTLTEIRRQIFTSGW